MSRSLLSLLSLLATVVLLAAAVADAAVAAGPLSSSSTYQQPLSSSSAALSAAPSTGSSAYGSPLSSSSSAPLQPQSTGGSSGMFSVSGGGGSGGGSSAGLNATGCSNWFTTVIQPRCKLANLTSTASFCSLSCAATYPGWFNGCINYNGPLYQQYQSLLATNGSAYLAMSAMAANCSACGQDTLRGFYSTCSVNQSQSSLQPANGTFTDLLYTMQFPSMCPMQCAANYSSKLLPFYNSCIAPYGVAAIPPTAAAFIQLCAPLTAPSAVSGVKVLALSAFQVAISWSPAALVKAPSDATQYVVVRGSFNGSSNQSSSNVTFVQQYQFAAGNGTQTSDFTVAGGAAYVYAVIACNSVGCSPLSALVSTTTPLPPPQAPAGLMAVNITASSAIVTWQNVTAVDNSTLFYVLSRQVLGSTLPLAGLYRGANTSFTFFDLQPNTTYVLSVVAGTYSAGQSQMATMLNFTTPFAFPSIVQNVMASNVSIANIRLQWSPPALIGAWSIVNYTVWVESAGSAMTPLGNTTNTLFDTSAVWTNAGVHRTYSFWVTAANSGGLSNRGLPPQLITVTTPANSPTIFNPVMPAVSPLGGSVTLAWNQSSDLFNGGSPITALHLSLTSMWDSREIDLPASAQMYTVSALNASAQYNVTWRAMNAYGWSALGPNSTFFTKSAAPVIVAFTAGDACACLTSFGVNSTLSIQFGTSVQGPDITTQAGVDALFVFMPSIPGNYVGQWINNGSVAVITVTSVSSTTASYTIGLVSVLVSATLIDSSNMSASAMGQLSPPLSGSWYGAPRGVRFFGVNQTIITVQEDSSMNPISVIPAPSSNGIVASTAMLTLSVAYGTLSAAKPSLLGVLNASLATAAAATNQNNITLLVPYSALAALLQSRLVTYTPMQYSTTNDVLMATVTDTAATNANPFDSVNVPIVINQINHAPSIRFNVSAGLPAWVFGLSYVLPPVIVSDLDATVNPSASLSVVLSAQSVTALLTLNSTVAAPSTVSSSVLPGNSAPSLTLTGPLADLNAYLASSPISVADSAMPPSSTQANLQLFVNDNGNGGGGPLTASTNAAVLITCNSTAAPTVTSAVFGSDAGSILLTFSSPLDQSATTSTDCSVFFDYNSTVTSFGVSPSCPFRGMNQLAVVLGFGATILPGQTLTFATAAAVRRCAGGLLLATTVTVQPPAITVTPIVTVSGPSIISQCDTLTLYGQATGLGGRPSTATYSWTVAIGDTADPTLAVAAPTVLGSSATAAMLTVSSTALYASSSYYFFYLTVTNFLGASNTSSIVVYKSTLPLPILLPQGSSALTVAASSAFFVAVTPVLSACVTGDNRVMNFSWSISPSVGSMPPSNNPQINVPAFTLIAGNTYAFTLTGVMAADATLFSTATITVTVPASPIGVSITGGSVQQSSQLVPLTLSAVGVDPDSTSTSTGNWSFAWSCLSSAGVACLDAQQGATLSTIVPAGNSSSSSLTILAGKLAADLYSWTVVATNGARTATSSVSVSIVANPIPIVSIASYLTIVNPNGVLYYAASANDATNTALSYSWSQVSGPLLALSTVAVSLKTNTLVLNNQGASVFTAGATYAFQCVVVNGFNQSSFAQVAVTINAPPHGGSLSVSPSSGFAFNTSFSLTADGWQSSTGTALSYQFYALAADSSLTQLNVRSGASVFNTQLAQGLNPNVTVLVVITDALGATSVYSALVAVQPPPGLANDTSGAVYGSILSNAATSASQTSNVGQLFGTLNALQDSIYLALLSAQSANSASRRLLSFSATSVALTSINTQALQLVAANAGQTDVLTMVNTAIKQTSQPLLTSADAVHTSGQSIVASLAAATASLSTSTDQAKAAAQTVFTSIIQLAGQQLAVLQLAEANGTEANSTEQADITTLLSNISARCDNLSSSLTVPGMKLTVNSSSSISVFIGNDIVTDSATYGFPSLDNSSVTFPAYSMAGAQPTDNSAALSNSTSQQLDSRVFYMPSNLYVWAANPMTALSPVVYAARVSTTAVPLTTLSTPTVTMVISVPVSTAQCPPATCQPVCFVWDGTNSVWNSSSALVSSSLSVYVTSSGQSFMDCSVHSATAASAAVMAVTASSSLTAQSSTGQSSTTAQSALSSSSSYTRLSSSSAAVLAAASSSSSAGPAAGATMATSSVTLLYPAGSQRLAFYLTVPSGVDVTSAGFIANVTSSIAADLAQNFNVSVSQIVPYVDVLSVTASSGSSRRRLLQAASSTTANIDFVLLSTISTLGNVTAGAAASFFQAAAAAGTLTPPYGATIPKQTVAVVDANQSPSSSSSGVGGTEQPSSSSSSHTSLAIGLAVGLGVPALVAIIALIYFFVIKGGSAPVANGMLHQRLPAGSASQ